jgi:uncharacterized protein YdhG (YjbR/CyaY superfamily)
MGDAGPFASIDAWLASLPADQRAALQALRTTILSVAPTAVEGFGYGLPAFRVDGRAFCYLGAAKGHCALYPGGGVEAFADELAGFSISKGTIRFQPDRPIPEPLLRRILADSLARAARRPGKA